MRLAAALLVALVIAGCAGETGPSPPAVEPDRGPEWSLAAIDGATYTRDDPPANATVLFFMATWCSSCRATAPVIAEAADAFGARGVRTLSVGFDPSESNEDLAAWQARYDQPWPHGIDAGAQLQRLFGVTSQSSVVVLDANGNLVESWGYGRVTEDALTAALERALAA